MNSDRVTRPAALLEVPLRDLVDAYHQHIGRLVDARHGIGQPQRPGRGAGYALDALAVQHAIAEQVLFSRWVNVRDALEHGATLAEVATAMGLDVDEVVVGLQSWADGQRAHCGMTSAEYAALVALLSGGDR